MPKANVNAHTRRSRHRQVQNNPDNHRQFRRMWHQQHIGQSSIYRSCSIGYRRENATLCHDATVAQCRAGWIAACTTVLCLQFDSPTLDPRFPIPRPIALLLGHIALGRVTSHWVASHHIGSHHSTSGRITAHRVGLHHVVSRHIGLHHIELHRIGLHRIGLHRIGHIASGWVSCTIIGLVALLSGQLRYYWVSCTVIGPVWCAFPPCFCPAPLHTLPHHSLRRFNLYLHTSLFSFCHCDPGHLPLTLALPYPCHLSLRYF